jgi:hypothetical protein
MSETPRCPYCGAILWEGPVKHKEEGTKIICDACARTYVYLPGYGSFALSDSEAAHFEQPLNPSYLEDDKFSYSKDRSLAKACFTLCCLLSSIPFILIMIVMALF